MEAVRHLDSGVTIFFNASFRDTRGVFLKAFKAEIPPLHGYHVKQVNYVETAEQNTLRGLHYQTGEFAESKLFRCIRGSAQLGFVDMRPGSATYGKGESVVLENAETAVLIPAMFATGYLVLADQTCMLYLSDNDYSAKHESGVRWDDPSAGIQWKRERPVLSEKDLAWPVL